MQSMQVAQKVILLNKTIAAGRKHAVIFLHNLTTISGSITLSAYIYMTKIYVLSY